MQSICRSVCRICCINMVSCLQSPSALTVVDNPESTVEDEEVHLDGEGDTKDLEVVQPTLLWQTLKPGKSSR